MSHERERMNGDEALSALVDGELGGAECRRLLDRLIDDDELRARWSRYHAGRATLEGNGPSIVSADFSERVLAAVGEEPAVLAPSPAGARARGARRRPAAVAAVAAAVAVVTVGAVFVLRDAGPGATQPAVAERDAAPAIGADARVAASGTSGHGPDSVEQARVRQRLAVYLNSHNGFAAAAEMPGVMPYSRLVGLNAGQ